ncbi:glycoside hydrolase [Rickettsiella endosymbiont of Miltochrista miniata]|uniref:glycoside hydrolase n=1 Tax=Rickettsiella endosymbiont of Miltochrista miniata TaxID=3066239 RepID=UPI00313E9E72
MMFKKFWPVFLGLLLTTSLVFAKENFTLKARTGEFTIDPATLAISVAPSDDAAAISLTQASLAFDEVKDLKIDNKTAQWTYPHLKMQVKVVVDEQGLKFSFKTNKEQTFQWPLAGLTPQAKALVLPDGEGLYIPNHDTFWRKEFNKYPNLSLSIPFWAIEYSDENYVSYIWNDHDVDTDAQVREKQTQLYVMNEHHFLKRSHFPEYTLLVHLTGDTPISPALDYRNLLINENKFVSLKQKILENANVNKLLGAFHIWVYGDGRNLAMLDELNRLGIKHAWIGYGYGTSFSEEDNVNQDYVRTAESRGYLVAPYDSFANAQNPKTSDSITSIWTNHLWPEACIRNADGAILLGFHKRGCYLSSEALRLREPKEKNIANQLNAVMFKGDNSLFLDCDASGPPSDDYSKQHPMTREQDLNNLLKRMRYISSTKKIVLGSETGLSWANPTIAYNNGAFLVFPEAFWPSLKNKKQFGGWWPDEAPKVLFKPYNAPDEFIRSSYNPRYRLPLYEAVFHDSVITTDRWELNELKIPAIRKTKALLQNLYNVPPIWVLDQKTLQKNKKYFVDYYNFFSPLHQMTGIEPLTTFDWLTDDRLVQQTQFGNRLILTANFSDKYYEDIGPHCIQAEWKEDGSKSLFCPKN